MRRWSQIGYAPYRASWPTIAGTKLAVRAPKFAPASGVELGEAGGEDSLYGLAGRNLWHKRVRLHVEALVVGVFAGSELATGGKAIGDGLSAAGVFVATPAGAVGKDVGTAGDVVIKGAGKAGGAVDKGVQKAACHFHLCKKKS
jgi:hypothetical protein